MKRFTLHLSNIHCSECEIKVQSILSRLYDFQVVDDGNLVATNWNAGQLYLAIEGSKVELLINDKCFRFKVKNILNALRKGGFKIDSWEVTRNGTVEASSVFKPTKKLPKIDLGGFLDFVHLYRTLQTKKQQKRHQDYCPICRAQETARAHLSEEKKTSRTSISLLKFDASSLNTIAEPNFYEAVFSVQGMSCSEHSADVMTKLDQMFGDSSGQKYSVDLEKQRVAVVIKNKQLINQITEEIRLLGFDIQLVELLPLRTTVKTKVTTMIGGMTCAACCNSITTAVNDLPFVLESAVDLVSKSGTFVIEDSPEHLEELQTVVEDCGFDFDLVSTEDVNFTLGEKKTRTVRITVEGMYCHECPELITEYLNSFGNAIVLEDEVTLKDPVIKFTYIPGGEITVRRILKDLNHLVYTDVGFVVDYNHTAKFKCTLTSEESIDQKLKKMYRRELQNILIRLGIATLFAIPTFVFGIVAMSLLPKTNLFRQWTEKPIWAGNTSRNNWILLFLSTPVYFFAADIFHRKVFIEMKYLWWNNKNWKRRIFKFGSMNLLTSLGTSVAYFSSIAMLILSSRQKRLENGEGSHTTYFDSVVFLTFFLLIGKGLESISRINTAEAISSLSNLKKATATIVDYDGQRYINDEEVDIKLLEIGDYVKISVGDSPPIDCVIVEGSSDFDESALTGESLPITRSPGHQIFTGTINTGESVIIAKVLTLEGDSLIDQIVKTVRDGQMRKAPIQRLADTITGYFVPVIVLLAVVTWVIWLALGYSNALPKGYLDIDTGGWALWSLEFAIAVFVVACPCGIGLAAPTALFVGSGLASTNGILAKGGGASFQDGAKTNVVCFDKTGTLTYGEAKITDYMLVLLKNLQHMQTVLTFVGVQLSRDLEVSSKHPLARAVKEFADRKIDSLGPIKIPEVITLPGLGLKGDIIVDVGEEQDSIWRELEPKMAILGNEKLMKEYNVEITHETSELLTKWKKECKSVVLLAITCPSLFGDEMFHLIMCMACRDEIRTEAPEVVAYLTKKLGMECWMITGDNSLTAHAIGEELGISNIVSEVLPSEKEAQIKKIQAMNPKNVVAMIGDGINDAPALALANVGISLSSGADLAVNASDFILLNKTHPLISIVTLFDLCQVVFRRIKFNFGWALVYNCIGIPVAAGVIYPYNNSRLDPVWASVAMALSSLSVVSSSLLLKLYKSKLRPSDFVREEAGHLEVKENIIVI